MSSSTSREHRLPPWLLIAGLMILWWLFALFWLNSVSPLVILFPTTTPSPQPITADLLLQLTLLQRLATPNQTWISKGEFSPHGDLFALPEQDGISLWKLPEFVEVRVLGRGVNQTAVAFSPQDHILAAGGWDGQIRLYDFRKGVLVRAPMAGHLDRIVGLNFSPDGKLLVSISWDGTARLWEVASGQPIGAPFQEENWPITHAYFTPDGTTLITGSHVITFWDVASQTRQKVLSVPEIYNGVASLALSHDGNTLAAGTINSLLLWDLHEPDSYRSYQVGYNTPSALAFSPDDSFLVVGSRECVLHLWSLTENRFLTTYVSREWRTGFLHTTGLSFSPEGWWLTASGCGEVSFWGLPRWDTTATPTLYPTFTPAVSKTPSRTPTP